MAASKRDFQEFSNKEEFNFSINNGVIRFPTLYNIDSKERVRIWDIYVELKSDSGQIDINNKYISNNEIHELKKTYSNLQVEIYTKTGIVDMKITKSAPTIINNGKNIGKSNETNIITQALIESRSKYLKKIDSGYLLSINESKINDQVMPYPMALHRYDLHNHKIKYPCYIQPKLDGIRLIAYYDKTIDSIVFKSRKLKDISGFDYIKKELKSKLKKYPNIFLDGELYCHGLELQAISGIVRNEEKSAINKLLSFNIFDCFDINNPSWKFQDRIVFVNENWEFQDRMCFINKITETNKYAVSVLTEEVNSEECGNELYKKYISAQYEGIVYKNKNGLYKYSFNKEHRSYDVLKRKQQFDDEFKIVDYTTGTKGKSVGSIIFIMATKKGKTFHVTPNITQEEQKRMYKIAKENFDGEYFGKMATIRYDDLSNDDVPLRAKFISIRENYM
jgi:hypothetical protein